MTKSTFDDAIRMMAAIKRHDPSDRPPVTILIAGCLIKGNPRNEKAQDETETKYTDLVDGIQLFDATLQFANGDTIEQPVIFIRHSAILAIS